MNGYSHVRSFALLYMHAIVISGQYPRIFFLHKSRAFLVGQKKIVHKKPPLNYMTAVAAACVFIFGNCLQ